MPARATRLALSIVLAVAAACRATSTELEQLAGPVCSDPPPTVHDAERKARLEQELERLTREGTAPRLAAMPESPGVAGLARTTDDVLPDDVLVDRIRPSVVVVGRRYLCGRCDRWHASTATGFAIAPDAIVTALHVLGDRDDSSLAIMTDAGEVHPVVARIAADPAGDVVVLRVATHDLPPLPMRAAIRAGAAVHVLSHPDGAFYYYTSGVLARRFPFHDRSGVVTEMLDVTAPFAKGSSGGPVVDGTGAVVGVVRATDSVYYEEEGDRQRDLQMVFRRCTPVETVIALVR